MPTECVPMNSEIVASAVSMPCWMHSIRLSFSLLSLWIGAAFFSLSFVLEVSVVMVENEEEEIVEEEEETVDGVDGPLVDNGRPVPSSQRVGFGLAGGGGWGVREICPGLALILCCERIPLGFEADLGFPNSIGQFDILFGPLGYQQG